MSHAVDMDATTSNICGYQYLYFPASKILKSFHSFLLRNLARDMGEKHGLTINLSVENDLNLPENVQLAFFRVAQEALNNAVKHSKATELQILFDGLETQALLSVQDFGTGFDPDFLDATRFGLRSMSERLTAIGGTLEIETAPGQGTQITAIWYDSDDRND